MKSDKAQGLVQTVNVSYIKYPDTFYVRFYELTSFDVDHRIKALRIHNESQKGVPPNSCQ